MLDNLLVIHSRPDSIVYFPNSPEEVVRAIAVYLPSSGNVVFI